MLHCRSCAWLSWARRARAVSNQGHRPPAPIPHEEPAIVAAPPPSCQLACFQEFRFQALGGSLIRGSVGLGSSIIHILFGSEALGSSILCILRGSEALGSSTIRILRVPKLPGAQNQLGYRKCAPNYEFLAVFSRKQLNTHYFCSMLSLDIGNMLQTLTF